MINEHYLECRIGLPAINETFPQFSRPISLLPPSPLDLSLRASNVIPITPPSTPSPPRKRARLMSDEHFLWRPHATATSTTTIPPTAVASPLTAATAGAATTGNYMPNMTYPCGAEFDPTLSTGCKSNLHQIEVRRDIVEIPEIQPSVQQQLKATQQQQQQQQHKRQQLQQCDLATIYVDDDETIILTEDEDDEREAEAEAEDEMNGTLASSQDYAEPTETDDGQCGSEMDVDVGTTGGIDEVTKTTQFYSDKALEEEANEDEEEEEEYVDVLSNDDDELQQLSVSNTLRLQRQALEAESEATGRVLTRNKLIYDNKELHQLAIDGLQKLFDRDFKPPRDDATMEESNAPTTQKTYTNLSGYSDVATDASTATTTHPAPAATTYQNQPPRLSSGSTQRPPYHGPKPTSHKSERKRTKLRKNLSQDEETLSPVSGTIIRKLRDDEELVVRKGDIDPAFNVVEITEEAKAILASIDNKIGAYLCQLCRTLYDDAFMLAQHRCPRIVHIEYKCSECEKVFNCPANLASHRRWHKPKSELLTNNQGNKKRHSSEASKSLGTPHDKAETSEGLDGIFPCVQCGKTFRRHAYLKKHQASHQMLENLKSLEIFKNDNPNFSHHNQQPHHTFYNPVAAPTNLQRPPPGVEHYSHAKTAPTAVKTYPSRLCAAFPFSSFDQRRFYTLGEIYLSQQLERSSAFQYVQANHMRNLTAGSVAGNFMPRPLVPNMMSSLPVK